MEIFTQEPDGRQRDARKLMGRRNYVAVVAYDPEVVAGGYGGGMGGGAKGGEVRRLSLAVDFMVQSDAAGGMGGAGVIKYGPVIVPSLDLGR